MNVSPGVVNAFKKIIFLSGNPISRLVGEKLDPCWYKNNGFDVEYWNLRSLYYSEKALSAYFGGHKDYRFHFPGERIFNNKEEVNQALENITSDVVFCHIDFNHLDDYWLRRLFKCYSIKYYVGPRRTSQGGVRHKSVIFKSYFVFRKTLSAIMKRARLSYIKKKINNILYKYTDFYQKPIFVVGSGVLGRNELLNLTQARCFVSVPSTDLNWEQSSNLLNQPYCVYVDDGVLYSPDQKMKTGKQTTSNDIDQYSKNMCNVFTLIEKTLHCQVVIAASGKYDYQRDDIFDKRKVFYGKTNQLIQHAELVVGHASSATWQAIIDLKPIVLLLDSSFIAEKNIAISTAAVFLGLTPIKSTQLRSVDLHEVVVNCEQCNKLVELYFCEPNIKGDSKELIARTLNKYVAA